MGSETVWRNYDVHYYQLDLHFVPDSQSIHGSSQMFFTRKENQFLIQFELLHTYQISAIDFQQQTLPFYRTENRVYVILPKNFPIQGNIKIHYSGKPPVAKNAPWDGGAVWTLDKRKRNWAGIAVQNDGAHLWWPCKDSWEDKPDSMLLTYHCHAQYQVIGNGNLISEKKSDDVYTSVWKISNPISTYNVSFYLGKYSSFLVPFKNHNLRFYVLDYNKAKARKHFKQVESLLYHYEDLFGPYPFYSDGFKVVEAPYWGMEHQSAVAYGNQYKTDVAGIDFILMHEIAHEWWGNDISAQDPAWMWIHEAMATYSEALFLERFYDQSISLQWLMHQRQQINNRKIIEGKPNCRFHQYPDADMYYRGTWMMHTLRNYLHNDSLWFKTLRSFFNSNKKIFTGKEFEEFFIQKTQRNLSSYFDYFVRSTEVPTLQIKKTSASTYIRWKSKVPFSLWYRNEYIPIHENGFTATNLTVSDFQTLQFYFYFDIEVLE